MGVFARGVDWVNETEVEQIKQRLVELVQYGKYQEMNELVTQLVECTPPGQAAADQVEELRQQLDKISEPPLTRAVVVGRNSEGGHTLVVSLGGQQVEVVVLPDVFGDLPDGDLIGFEAWLNGDKIVTKVRPAARHGEVADVKIVHDDGRLEVNWRGNDELLVTPAAGLGSVKSGDRVRLDSSAAVAFEVLASPMSDDLALLDLPDVTYEDIGGQDRSIEQIREAIEHPYLHFPLYERYSLKRPRGILLYGPPGCGKTMIAKAIANSLSKVVERNLEEIATSLELLISIEASNDVGADRVGEWIMEHRPEFQAQHPTAEVMIDAIRQFISDRGVSLDENDPSVTLDEVQLHREVDSRAHFLSIKGPELLNKWVGETENSIRRLFSQARGLASIYSPVVIFFDEIEALFRRRGSRVTSDMDSTVVPQFLSEIDGIDELRNVIIVGATNRQDLLDPAILRPGRLDVKIEVTRPGRDAAAAIAERYLSVDLPYEGDPEVGREDAIERMIGVLYNTESHLSCVRIGDTQPTIIPVASVMSGAMIESIVSRAKRMALRRNIDHGVLGLTPDLVIHAVRDELNQNRNAIVASELQAPEDSVVSELRFGETSTGIASDRWLVPVLHPWAA